jgi:HSP20 family protein
MKALIPWRRTTDPTNMFRHEIDDLFDRFFGVESFGNGPETTWAPRIDMETTEKEIIVKADLPGVDPKDLEITVLAGALVLKGVKKEEKEEKNKNFHRVERFTGAFYREIPLPVGVDADKIVATSAKGVVTVTIPKTPEALPKKVTVKAMT